jgi:hypothetical protein
VNEEFLVVPITVPEAVVMKDRQSIVEEYALETPFNIVCSLNT